MKRKKSNRHKITKKELNTLILLFIAGIILFLINTTTLTYIFKIYPELIDAVFGNGSWWIDQSLQIKIIYVGLLSPILEEIIFRGLILNWFLKRNMEKTGIIISSAIFALYHPLFGWGLMKAVIMFPVGIIFALIYTRYGLKGSISTHLGNNLSYVALLL